MTDQALVVFDGVAKRFGAFVAVEKMNLDIRKGEFLAIMGSSGCGKTTTLRMLAGLEAPSEGEIRLAGKRINDLPTWQRDTPMVWQSLALFPFLTVRENVEFSLRMRGIEKSERRRRVDKWLERMQIAEFADRNVAHLSGGQRQRVALARSLVTEPEILLLDEPLSALDAHLKVRMQTVLSNLQRELGITFVYVTHSQSEAFSMADRVVIMSRGRIEQIGDPQEIYRAPRTRFVAEFLGSSNIFGGSVTAVGNGAVRVATPAGEFDIAANPVKALAKGDKATFVVSDDRVQLSNEKPAEGINAVRASVVGEEFVGATAVIHLEGPDGIELKAQKSHDELEHLNLAHKADVWLTWRPEAGHILPGE
ncbi:ABC transporter ATP-binding protein [Mesorhizobium hungaricum]|jgi:spermidine/putrescine transport system ATP-binding protein|uniref:ABC transporter ATP-binding protein n=1 Tax=Mesorhizobium hungaricum TaxID=1566387 RepID=A0A1C2EDC8_9HYPH|nr:MULTISPECIES: ABC transporter ATP-binding protein [Mesorhizobium]MBN9237999.1 ABC transporter ATP-binding protein [Mesorhizobium sp.]MDQ0333450.1 spermidine/putrescine transport system ATP-binding protein [Mesorhizobium sp. YL-MeA3-2017]OCX24976.1 ABC transporter ATP-binding protein [Mesorhizobium hungaricum]